MAKSVARVIIDRYRKVLDADREPERRQVMLRLSAAERAKLAALDRQSSPQVLELHPPRRNPRLVAAASPATANEGVSHLNLEYYRKRLETETSSVMKGILIRLIAEEEGRLALPEPRTICGDD